MPSFGEQLKRAREKRSISLDDISISTKISTRMLRALEDDHFDQLPGGIFNKGFVRAYARCVGLDENQTIAEFLVASGEEQPGPVALPEPAARKPEPEPAPVEEEKTEKPWTIPWGALAIVLLVAALGLAFWQKRIHQDETEPASMASTSAAAPKAKSDSVPAESSQPSETSTTPAATAPSAAVSSPSASSSAAVVLGSTATSTPNAPAQISILIKAREECWISATVDGKPVFEGTLDAAGAKKISGQHRAVIKAGNAGAVDIFFNGKKVPTDGQEGEVKAFSFDENGLSTVTSTAAAGTHE